MAIIDRRVSAAMRGLTITQRRFVVEYCTKARGNAQLAAKLAGVEGDVNSLEVTSRQWLRMPKVRSAINTWMEAYAMSATEVTDRIRDMADVNPGPFVAWSEDGSLTVKVPSREDWDAHKHWIKSIKADAITGKVVEFKLHDGMDALKEMAKILKLYSDAPIFALNLYLQNVPDAELLKQLQEARNSIEDRPLLALKPGQVGNVEEVIAEDEGADDGTEDDDVLPEEDEE